MGKIFTQALRLQITSANVTDLLRAINRTEIDVYDVVQSEELVVRITVRRSALEELQKLLTKRGENWQIIRRSGIYWKCKAIAKRPMLFCGISLIVLLAILLPTRIFFIRVQGNVQIPQRLILEKADACGIRFGANRRQVRSEKMKNALLQAIPELQWAGINTQGCVAIINVKERTDTQVSDPSPQVSRLIASRDGVITRFTVWNGNAQCKVGQAVRKGQLLVSGFTDCGISVQATRAQGEVFAITNRELQVVTPTVYSKRLEQTKVKRKYSLIIGKNKIKFYNDSSILDSSCVKIYSDNYITLPGGFTLPIALSQEVWITYAHEEAQIEESDAQRILEDFVCLYLPTQMLAGEILHSAQRMAAEDDVYILHGSYACSEMIAREQIEETIVNYGEDG